MKLAAIDIGSNAVRLLVCNVLEQNKGPRFKKELLVRSPIRLGEQAFLDGVIYENKISMLSKAMQAYKNLMEIYGVQHYRVFATSAMREAENQQEIVDRILKETGVLIEVVEGQKESATIFETYRNTLKQNEHPTFLSIDVGGGSTEMVLFHKGEIVDNRSFKIGTLRVKNFLVEKQDWKEMQDWLQQFNKDFPKIYGLGSGGNIIKIQKLYFKNAKEPIRLDDLKEIRTHLEGFSLRERIKELGLKPDRADVIVPAAKIFSRVVEWGRVKKLFVPKVGLSDGIIKEIYQDYQSKLG